MICRIVFDFFYSLSMKSALCLNEHLGEKEMEIRFINGIYIPYEKIRGAGSDKDANLQFYS